MIGGSCPTISISAHAPWQGKRTGLRPHVNPPHHTAHAGPVKGIGAGRRGAAAARIAKPCWIRPEKSP